MSANPRAAPAASPCVGICVLTSEQVCRGCGRHLDEIAAWGTSSEHERAAIVDRARARMLIIADRLTGMNRR